MQFGTWHYDAMPLQFMLSIILIHYEILNIIPCMLCSIIFHMHISHTAHSNLPVYAPEFAHITKLAYLLDLYIHYQTAQLCFINYLSLSDFRIVIAILVTKSVKNTVSLFALLIASSIQSIFCWLYLVCGNHVQNSISICYFLLTNT